MRHQPTFRFGALLLYALFAVSALRAQVTWFLPDDRWTFYGFYGFYGVGLEEISVGPQDTLWKGKIYKKLLINRQLDGYKGFRYVRQEGRKIWAWDYWDAEDRLLYDFSAKAGDSIGVYGPNSGYVVTKIDSLPFGQTQRLTQSIRWLGWAAYAPWATALLVEGIGAVQSPEPFVAGGYWGPSYLFSDVPPTGAVDGADRYFCHFESATGNYTAVVNRCDASPTHTPLEAGIDIYPNPSAGTLYIGGQLGEKTLLVSLYDMAGRLVLEQPCTGPGFIHTGFKGLAVLQITCEGRKMFKKIAFVP